MRKKKFTDGKTHKAASLSYVRPVSDVFNVKESMRLDRKALLFVLGIFIVLAGVFYFGKILDVFNLIRGLILCVIIFFISSVYFSVRGKELNKDDKIRSISAIVVIGFGAAVIYHYFVGAYLNVGYPTNSFLFIPQDRFMDFINNSQLQTQYNGSYSYGGSPTNYLFNLFSLFNNKSVVNNYVIFASFFTVFLLIYNFLYMKKQNYSFVSHSGDLFILTFLSYPYLFCIDRGNPEMLIFVFLSIAIYCHLRGRDILAAAFLSFAISAKIYFIIFLLLFLVDKKYKELVLSLLFMVIIKKLMPLIDKTLYSSANPSHLQTDLALISILFIFAISLVLVNWNKVYNDLKINVMLFLKHVNLYAIRRKMLIATITAVSLLAIAGLFTKFGDIYKKIYNDFLGPNVLYNANYAIGDGGAAHCSSIYGMAKEVLIMTKSKVPVTTLFNVYPFIVAVLFVGLLIYLFFVEKVIWKKVAILTLSLFAFPFVTADYRLIHIFIPMWLFINNETKSKFDPLYAIMFGLMLIPNKYFILRGGVGEGSITHALTIIVFMSLIIFDGIKNKLKQEC
jgi:hypothetical protein